MTIYEHAMVGASLAWAGGLHRRYGWRVVALAAFAAALPDWDGLSILSGGAAYAAAHRAWGHNLFVASLLGGLVAATDYAFDWLGKLHRAALRLQRQPSVDMPTPTARSLAVWVVTGVAASLSHLPIDVLYSGRGGESSWAIQLLWPVSRRPWAYPIVPWGDVGATLLFVAEMFAVYRWPRRAQSIALVTLLAVAAYVAVRWLVG
jgi:hypothetical protein